MAAGGGWGGGAAAVVYVGRDALSDRCTSFKTGILHIPHITPSYVVAFIAGTFLHMTISHVHA